MGILLVKGPSYATFLSLFSSFLTFGFNWFAHLLSYGQHKLDPIPPSFWKGLLIKIYGNLGYT